MAVAKGSIAAISMAKSLRAGVAPVKTRIPGVWKWSAHEFVRSPCILTIAEYQRLGRMPNLRSFRRLCNGFALAVANVARVVVIAGVRIVSPIRTASECRTLLDLYVSLPLP